jgi:hypothetical protein
MFQIEIKSRGEVTELFLNSSNGNEQSVLAIEPTSGFLSELIQQQLSNASGAFGHGLTIQSITPIDLHYALVELGYEFNILEGMKLVESYNPEIPDGAVT